MLMITATLTIINVFGGPSNQGYCFWDFILSEYERHLMNVRVELVPYPQNEIFSIAVIEIDEIGKSHSNQMGRAQVEGECGIEEFRIVKASATLDGSQIDLLSQGSLVIQEYKPTHMSIGK